MGDEVMRTRSRSCNARASTPAAAVLLALVGALACTDDPFSPFQPAPGTPARIVSTTISVAGGLGFLQVTEIDSALGTYRYVECRTLPLRSECDEEPRVRAGSVPVQSIRGIFAAAHTNAFLELRPEYRRKPPISPDFESTTLVITANERRRTILWERGATLPEALAVFRCQLRATAGEMILCL